MMNATRPRLLAIPMPSGDRLFARHLRVMLERAEPATPRELQEQLRRFYPQAQVHRRELSGETHPTWYVYREGGLSGLPPGWWETSETGVVTVDAQDRVTSANARASAHLRLRHEELVGRAIRDLFPSGARGEVDRLLEIVRDVQFGETRWLLNRGKEAVSFAVRATVQPDELELRFAPVDSLSKGEAAFHRTAGRDRRPLQATGSR